MLQKQACQDCRGVGIRLQRCPRLAGVQEDFRKAPIGESAGGCAVSVPLELETERHVSAAVPQSLASGHLPPPIIASPAYRAIKQASARPWSFLRLNWNADAGKSRIASARASSLSADSKKCFFHFPGVTR